MRCPDASPPVTEGELLARVTRMCDERHLLYHHCHDSRYCRGTAGLPDLIISSRNGTIFVELKSASGAMTTQQTQWRWSLKASREQWHLWRPADFYSGAIVDALNYLAGAGMDLMAKLIALRPP